MRRIDFASRFPPRQFEPRALELNLGTLKIESGACDLPAEGSKERDVPIIGSFGILNYEFVNLDAD